MKKILILVVALASVCTAMAQETYENAKIATEDLNGTARYVGMGGAMDALGADISTIGTNPAGIGLFRRSVASVSFGTNTQQDAVDFAGANKTRVSFDQIGFVYSNRWGSDTYVNFAFNYHKSRNFGYILSAQDNLYGVASQNKLTYAKNKGDYLYSYEPNGNGYPNIDKSKASCNQLDYLYTLNLLYYNDQDNEWDWFYDNANAYTLDRNHKGYIGEYDFNLSGNVSDRFYWGFTVGYHKVHYKHYGEYVENLIGYDLNGNPYNYNILVSDDRKITGEGVDIKAGIIVRPIEESAFRFGLSVATPTMYDLTTSNVTTMNFDGNNAQSSESLDYKLYTPWKFGVSLGHTIGQNLAIGAGYEYADYGSLDSRYNTGEGYYDWYYGTYHDNSESDEIMNRHTEQTLKGVSTFKVGAEFKPVPELAVRLGYNYVSPMYNMDGFKDGSLDSDGSYFSSATDYTDWDATNRITCGLGYQIGGLNLSVAYQYSSTKGEFAPFMSYEDNKYAADDNICDVVKVNNKRHQLLFTIGYTF
ncbi:MAG: hemin receptor [Prevotella sp.]|nr:hemin receptor [Prevotella sp.]